MYIGSKFKQLQWENLFPLTRNVYAIEPKRSIAIELGFIESGQRFETTLFMGLSINLPILDRKAICDFKVTCLKKEGIAIYLLLATEEGM